MRHVAAMQHFKLLSSSRHLGVSRGVTGACSANPYALRQCLAVGLQSQGGCNDASPRDGAWGGRSHRIRTILRCRRTSHSTNATGEDIYIDLPEPKRQSVALPRILNSAGRIFTLAGLLKILVIAHGAVPWSAVSGWEAIVTMVPFGLVYLDVALRHDFGFPRAALVLVARFLLQMNFMQRRGSMFLLFAVAALVITAQRTLAPQKSRRAEVAMQPVRAELMQQDDRSQQRPLPSAEEAEGIWDRAENRVHELQATLKQKAAESK